MSAHAEFLRAASNNKELATQLKTDFRQAKLPERDFRMLEFVEKLTQFPWLLVESDIRLLRQAGFSDSEILHIVLGSAHFNYLNRMADGIGISFDYKSDIPQFEVPAQRRVAEVPKHQPNSRLQLTTIASPGSSSPKPKMSNSAATNRSTCFASWEQTLRPEISPGNGDVIS